jgi:hypothetical protein
MSKDGVITSILDRDIPFERLVSWIQCDDCKVGVYLALEDVFAPSFTLTWQELRRYCRQDVFGDCDLAILDRRFSELIHSPSFPEKTVLKRWIVAISVVVRENLSKRVFVPNLELCVETVLKWRQETRFALREGVQKLESAVDAIQ